MPTEELAKKHNSKNSIKLQYETEGVSYGILKNEKEHQALLTAIENGDLAKVKELHNYIYLVNARKTTGKKAKISPLLLATIYQHAHIVEFLIKNDPFFFIRIQVWNEDNENPLIEAIKSGNHHIVTLMVKSLPRIPHLKDKDGNTPLHYVGQLKDPKKRKQIAKILIKAKMYIHFENNKGEKPQHYDEMVAIEQTYQNTLLHKLKNAFLIDFSRFTFIKAVLSLLAVLGVGAALIIHFPAAASTYFYSCVFYFCACISAHMDYPIVYKLQINADFENMLKQGLVNQQKLKKYQSLLPLEDRISNSKSLTHAACSGNLDEIKLIYNQGASINEEDIRKAISVGNFKAFCFLVEKGQEELGNKFVDDEIMEVIIAKNRIKMLRYLLNKGIELPSTVMAYPPLTTPSQRAKVKAVGFVKEAIPLLEYARNKSASKQMISLIEKVTKENKIPSSKVVTYKFEKKCKSTRTGYGKEFEQTSSVSERLRSAIKS